MDLTEIPVGNDPQEPSVCEPVKAYDVEVAFICHACKQTAGWTMNDAVNSGLPVCPDCGDDMELDDEQEDYSLTEK